MAQRRMFSLRIVNSARFLQMPEGAQLLYFHLCMRADDDGVVEAFPVLKMLGTAPDNYRILMAREFIKQLNDDQVSVVLDWMEHNVIRADRKVDSIYKELLKQGAPGLPLLEAKPRSDVDDNSRRIGGQSTDRLGKDRLGKDRLENTDHSIDYLKSIPKDDLKELSTRYRVSEKFIIARADDVIDYCEAKGKVYKNYKAALRNFIKSHLERHPDEIIRPMATITAPIADSKPRTPEQQKEINKRLSDMRSQLSDKLAM